MQHIIELFRKELLELRLYSDKTVRNYISCIYMYFEHAKNQLLIDPIQARPKQLLKWILHLKQKELSYGRLTHHRAALKSFFSFLEKLGKVEKNPAEALLKFRKTTSDRNQPLKNETAFKLLRSIDRSTWLGERNFMIISLLWALGLRREELTSLKICDFEPDIDPKNKIGLLLVHGKGRKQRTLFMVDKLYTNLSNYLEHPETPGIKYHKRKYQAMFPNKSGKTISGHRVLMLLRQAALKAGIKERVTPHVLRHSFATEMFKAKTELDAISEMMGHDSIAETAIYVHIPDEFKKQALELIAIDGPVSWPGAPSEDVDDSILY